MSVIGGIIVLNLVLLFVFWIVHRQSRVDHKQFAMQSDDSIASMRPNITGEPSFYQDSPSGPPGQVPPYMQTTKSLQSSNASLPNVPPYMQTTNSLQSSDASLLNVPPYMQTTKALQNSNVSLLNVPPSIKRTSCPATLQAPPKVYTPCETKGQMLGAYQRRPLAPRSNRQRLNVPHHLRRDPSLLHVVSLTRNNSGDSASIYSSASAPIDADEYMFHPMTLEPKPFSAPACITTYADAPQPQSDQSDTQLSSQISTHIRKALAPETYTRPLPKVPNSSRSLAEFQGMPEHMKVPPALHLPSVTLPLRLLNTPPSSYRASH